MAQRTLRCFFVCRIAVLLWMAGILVSGIPSVLFAQTPGTSRRPPPSFTPAAAPPRSSIWKDGIGNGFLRGAMLKGFSVGAGFGAQTLGSHHRHDLRLTTV